MRARRFIMIPVLFVAAAAVAGEGRPEVDLDDFARIPVLHEGRLMPMDSFARSTLLQFSGRTTVKRRPALAWLADALFEPSADSTNEVFLINHPDVVTALGVEPEKRRRYSLAQLHPGLGKLSELARQASALEDGQRSLVEKEILRVFANVSFFLQLQASFDFGIADEALRVQHEGLARRLGLGDRDEAPSYADLFFHIDVLKELIPALETRPPEEWNEEEAEAFRLSSLLFERSRAMRNLVFTYVPADPHGGAVWLSGWDLFSIRVSDPELRRILQHLAGLPGKYRQRDQASFDESAMAVAAFNRGRMGDDRAARWMDLEVAYNRWGLFGKAGLAYGLAFVMGFLGFLFERRWLRRTALVLVLLALAPHVTGVVCRMLIMGRPPVTNLYATFLFVAFVVVCLGLVLEAFQRDGLGLLASGFGGLSLLLIAQRFLVDGDTMHKVVAVLNSNFWLSTHVITITIGYAGVLVAGLIGHVYLVYRAVRPAHTQRLAEIHRGMIGVLAFGLTFSFLGTMLGGVWADQSWGRFWGWDPKENGALVIVLWGALLFHARMGRMIGERGMAAGCVVGVILVLTAWLGVNLLSVGLHSYGFTTGLGLLYFGCTAAELVFLIVVTPLAGRGATGSSGPGLPSAQCRPG